MSEVKLTQNEFIVLRAYYDHKDKDYKNMNQMADVIGVQFSPFKKVVDKLKNKGWLTGIRKITMTPEGVATYEEAHRFLETHAAAQEESAPLDPSAAVVASNEPAVHTAEPARRMLSDIVADRLNVEPAKLWKVIRDNVISYNKDREPAPTDEEVMHVLSVMNKYELDPFVKQIHAFRHKGKLQVMVGVDGWITVANRNPNFKGVEYEFPPMDEMVTTKSGKKCWPWVKATCHVDGRVPTVAYAFLDEWYTETKWGDSAWEKHPTHRLKQKAYTTSVREGLGIALYDEADREQFMVLNRVDRTRIETATVDSEQLMAGVEAANLLPAGETDEFVEGDPSDDLFKEEGKGDNGDDV